MGLGAVIFIVVMFIAARILQQVGETIKRSAPARQRAPGDPPQTMADLLAEMRQQLETAQHHDVGKVSQPGHGASQPMSRAELSRRLPSMVPEERGGSIEVAGREEAMIVVDRDDEAEKVVRRRIDAAAARNGEWQESDHRRFDAKIRAVAPTAPVARSRFPLRQAMIWREVLGPPVGLRDNDDR